MNVLDTRKIEIFPWKSFVIHVGRNEKWKFNAIDGKNEMETARTSELS